MKNLIKTFIRKQKTESNEEKKRNEREQKREKLTDDDIDLGRFFKLASSDKTYVNGLNLHEIKSEFLLNYTGDFALNGSKIIGPTEHKTNIRSKNMDDFQNYINAIDIDYGSGDIYFTG